MIRIFSENEDFSASKVIEWINYYKSDYIRINNKPNNLQISVFLDNDGLNVKVNPDNKKDAIKTWYRRGYVYNSDEYEVPNNVDLKYFDVVKEHLKSEFRTFINFFYSIERSINSPDRYSVNKIDSLYRAKNIGLKVPKTLITKNKYDIFKYFGDKKPIISKPITDLLQIEKNGLNRSHLIKLLKPAEIINLPERFGISLFQEFINKKYEIRVFCINEKIFSVANFSNLNSFSKIDGRNVLNSEYKLNRIVPYLLSKEIECKIISLLRELQLESGSLDFIYGIDNNMYFLEVNPVGQFGVVSNYGNYYIEKCIAQILLSDE